MFYFLILIFSFSTIAHLLSVNSLLLDFPRPLLYYRSKNVPLLREELLWAPQGSSLPQPTHCSHFAARKLHLQDEMSAENPGGRVQNKWPQSHNLTGRRWWSTPLVEAASFWSLLFCPVQVSGNQSEKCLWAWSLVVLTQCTFGLSLIWTLHICITGSKTAEHLFLCGGSLITLSKCL